ncbi:restriction endonuclease subunit S [Pseudomonas sp. S2_C03]
MSAVKAERYVAYKDSGVEWIGEVPENWRTVRLKDLGFLQNGISKSGEYFGFGLPFVSYGNVYNNTISLEKIKTYANSTLEDQKIYSCRTGDVFFTRTSETIEEIGFSATCLKTIPKSVFSGFVIRFRPTSNKLTKEFSKFYFSANILRAFFCKEVAIVTRASLGQGLLNKLSVILPPIPEQTAIAGYLDTKTSQIDRQIDLLGQKATQYGKLKQSLINETVTRGLDKSAPMKGSGVEWIGEVPEHWEVKRIKEVCDINKKTLTEKTPASYEFDYVDIGSVTYGVREYTKERMTFDSAPSRAKRIVQKGDTIISTVRTYLKAIMSIDTEVIDLIVSTGFAVITPRKKIADRYCSYLLTSNCIVDEVCALSTGVSYPATNATVIGDMFFLIPPFTEQVAIGNFLDEKTSKIDNIVTTINQKIEQLKELRKVLINDVVTGKIKIVSEGAAV